MMNVQNKKTLVVLVTLCCAIITFHYSEIESRRLLFSRNTVLYMYPENFIGNQDSTSTNCRYCINHRIFKPVISPEQKYDIVLLIKSSHRKDAAERRQAIRSTWANDSHYLPKRVQHYFMLGKFYA